jgi:hypothetical protein
MPTPQPRSGHRRHPLRIFLALLLGLVITAAGILVVLLLLR